MDAVILRDIKAGYNGMMVINGASLAVGEGELFGIIGPNGSGKTTLIKVMLGLIKPFSGEVLIYGFPPSKGRRFVSYLPQDISFEKWFPARASDVVLMGRYNGGFFGYGRRDREEARRVLELVGMGEKAEKRIGELSGGEVRRVFLARALARDSKILVLDEPFSGIDEGFRERLKEIILGLKGEKTIIMVSHERNIPFDRVLHLGRGDGYTGL